MKISVIIPTLHREQDLKRLLSSFLIQSASPCEIIVIDQSDNYNTGKICLSYKEKLPLKYYHSSRKSLTHSRNFGIEKAKGDVVAFLDDDTELQPDYLERIYNFFKEHPEAIGGMGRIINHGEFRDRLMGRGLLYKMYMAAACFFCLNSPKRVYCFDIRPEHTFL